MASHTKIWLWLVALVAFMLAGASPTQARHRDNGNVIKCSDLASCFGVAAGDSDLSGADASDIVSVGDDEGPDLPPVDQDPTVPPATDSNTSSTPATPQVQTPTVQTTTTITAAAGTTTQEVETSPATPKTAPTVTKTEPDPQPPPPPPPFCINHPDWPSAPAGWQKSKDGNCYEIPKLDLSLTGPASVNAPGGNAKFTVTIVNNGSNLASAVLYKQQLDANGNLTLVDLKASQGDSYGKMDDRTFVCSIGTILPGQSATVTISIKAVGSGSVTIGVVEPGGEADTNTDNNRLTTNVVLTALQTLLSVKQHGLQWGGHYYRDTQVFARVLAREGSTWRGWKKNHPALAAGLLAHESVARQHKK